jgi:hypothetical protein
VDGSPLIFIYSLQFFENGFRKSNADINIFIFFLLKNPSALAQKGRGGFLEDGPLAQ